jgi:hypothetical protein
MTKYRISYTTESGDTRELDSTDDINVAVNRLKRYLKAHESKLQSISINLYSDW